MHSSEAGPAVAPLSTGEELARREFTRSFLDGPSAQPKTGTMTTELDNEEIIRQVIGELEKKFAERQPEEIETVVREEFSAIADRPVRDYVLILTERAAKKRLKNSGKARE